MSESQIDDYEWKLLPDAQGKLPDATADDFDGSYFVLSFDKHNGRFIFQHDTFHVGMMGRHWEQVTYTEIRRDILTAQEACGEHGVTVGHPPIGWLRDHLLDLIARFAPNQFSRT